MTPDVLGKLANEHSERDAVHIAIVPVKAGYDELSPGAHVGIVDGKATILSSSIGIVDPFLSCSVKRGESFWLLLYPGSITSLRHDWTHPAFTATPQTEKSVSVQWLEGFCGRYGISWDNLLANTKKKEGWYCFPGETIRDNAETEKETLAAHLSVVMGAEIKGDNLYFSCAC